MEFSLFHLIRNQFFLDSLHYLQNLSIDNPWRHSTDSFSRFSDLYLINITYLSDYELYTPNFVGKEFLHLDAHHFKHDIFTGTATCWLLA
jgi:hypothetical protein